MRTSGTRADAEGTRGRTPCGARQAMSSLEPWSIAFRIWSACVVLGKLSAELGNQFFPSRLDAPHVIKRGQVSISFSNRQPERVWVFSLDQGDYPLDAIV